MRIIVKGFFYFVYVLIAGGLIAAIALTFHDDRLMAPAKPQAVHQIVKPKPQAQPKSDSLAVKPTSGGSRSGSGRQPEPATNSSTAARPTASSSLTDTGPGDLVIPFTLSVVAGAFIRRQQLIRRQRMA